MADQSHHPSTATNSYPFDASIRKIYNLIVCLLASLASRAKYFFLGVLPVSCDGSTFLSIFSSSMLSYRLFTLFTVAILSDSLAYFKIVSRLFLDSFKRPFQTDRRCCLTSTVFHNFPRSSPTFYTSLQLSAEFDQLILNNDLLDSWPWNRDAV